MNRIVSYFKSLLLIELAQGRNCVWVAGAIARLAKGSPPVWRISHHAQGRPRALFVRLQPGDEIVGRRGKVEARRPAEVFH